MDVQSLLTGLQSLALAERIRQGTYLFPLLESVHVIGLSLVFGTIMVFDLRLLGFASTARPVSRMMADIVKWTWLAFVITAATGALMFITNATVYYDNAYFRAKIALLVLAGLNMAAFEVTARRTIHQWDRSASAPTSGKVVAGLSLAIWIGVIVTGRLIGFTTSRATVPNEAPAEINLDDLFGAPAPAPDSK